MKSISDLESLKQWVAESSGNKRFAKIPDYMLLEDCRTYNIRKTGSAAKETKQVDLVISSLMNSARQSQKNLGLSKRDEIVRKHIHDALAIGDYESAERDLSILVESLVAQLKIRFWIAMIGTGASIVGLIITMLSPLL